MKNTKTKLTESLENVNLIEKRLRELLSNLTEDNKETTFNEIKMINELLLRTLKGIRKHKLIKDN